MLTLPALKLDGALDVFRHTDAILASEGINTGTTHCSRSILLSRGQKRQKSGVSVSEPLVRQKTKITEN
jgi:hypothetical protein